MIEQSEVRETISRSKEGELAEKEAAEFSFDEAVDLVQRSATFYCKVGELFFVIHRSTPISRIFGDRVTFEIYNEVDGVRCRVPYGYAGHRWNGLKFSFGRSPWKRSLGRKR